MLGITFLLLWVIIIGCLFFSLHRHNKEMEECDRLLKEAFERYHYGTKEEENK